MKKRELRLNKYGISGKRYKELCGFCEQYPEWIDELRSMGNMLQSKGISDMSTSQTGAGSQTEKLAIKQMELNGKCELIEQTAIQADAEIYPYIIKSVCYEVPFKYLQAVEEIPCASAAFYDKRRYFFYLLDKNKKR